MRLPEIHNERGSILLYSMLTMASMLAIGLTLNGLFLSKLRLSTAARNATIALYAADSGVEMCLYEARTGTDEGPLLTFVKGFMVLGNGAKFKIVDSAPPNKDITADCSVLASGSFGFRATGTYQGTTRALEISQ